VTSVLTAALLLAPSLALLAPASPVDQASAAPAVEGVIRSSSTDRPLPYAHVQVRGDTLADWTDEAGVYRLEGLPRGEWQLRVVHTGHDSLDLTVFVPGDRSIRLDVTLSALPGPPVDALADFEPFRVEFTLPALLNPLEVSALMQRLYPPELTMQGVGGEAVLQIWLDERGRVVRTTVSQSSGHAELDSVALVVSDRMRFRPARNRQDAVRVIVLIPVLFTVPGTVLEGDAAVIGSRPVP
jgi:TonB family protein